MVYRFVLAQGHFWASAGFKWQLAKKIQMAETSKRGTLAYFFLRAFLLQRFELPVLVFVDEYPASLNVRYCLVKQQTGSLFFYTDKYNNSGQWVSFARRNNTKNAMLTVQLNKICTKAQAHWHYTASQRQRSEVTDSNQTCRPENA